MNLVIDIGNTRSKLGIFDGDKIIFSAVAEALSDKQLNGIFRKHPINNCILSAVSSFHNSFKDILSKNSDLIILDCKTSVPFKNKYKTPLTLGKDRIAVVAGAYSLYPHENVLVMDIGTAITYEFINSSGDYLGGGISPGVKLRLKALNAYTHNLPLIESQPVSFLTGTGTKDSMLSGVINGTRLELEGFISEYSVLYENLRVLITGGDSAFFETSLKSKIFAIPNLVLIGLNKILQHNASPR